MLLLLWGCYAKTKPKTRVWTTRIAELFCVSNTVACIAHLNHDVLHGDHCKRLARFTND